MIYGLQKLNGAHPTLWAAMAYLGVTSQYDWKIISGYRDSVEQESLYAIGRTTQLGSKTVTDAHGGQSAHNYGLALDVVPTLDKGVSTVTDTEHPAWRERDTLLANFPGIQPAISTSSGRDWAHVELKDWQMHKEWKNSFTVCTGILAIVALAYGAA